VSYTRPRVMSPSAACQTGYSEADLKGWAAQALGAKRCSSKYLAALATIFGNMARADLQGATLLFTTIAPYASRQTMRTILAQLSAAGLVKRWHNPKQAVYAYQGVTGLVTEQDAATRYNRIQRHAEEADALRYSRDIGIHPSDCPY
jgi:hypothetical protein